MHLESGYKTITPIQLCNAIWALDAGAITYRAFRIYLACFSLQAAREAAHRVRRREGRRGDIAPRYRVGELVRLVPGTSEDAIRRELGRLRRAGILTFSERAIVVAEAPLPSSEGLLARATGPRSPRRPIPVARPMLRFLAGCRKPALARTVAAYLVRGLSLDRRSGEVNGRGTVKLSWIAGTFGVSERAARYARAELVRLGWIGRDERSYQRKLNRDGSYFEINPSWTCPGGRGRPAREGRGVPSGAAPLASSSRDPRPSVPVREIAPRGRRNCPESAPPREKPETPLGSKNQGTRGAEPPGVFGESGRRTPTIRDVRVEDLRCFGRAEELYWQAVATGLITHSEASALGWLGAAVRARGVDGDPVRVFVGIVRRGLWKHITQEQEERARRALARYRETDPRRFRVRGGVGRASEAGESPCGSLPRPPCDRKPPRHGASGAKETPEIGPRGGQTAMVPVREALHSLPILGEDRCGPETWGVRHAAHPGSTHRCSGEELPIVGGGTTD